MVDVSCFSERFTQARVQKKFTLKQLASMTGASVSALSHYASGTNLPPLDVAAKLAAALEVSLDWLCDQERKENDPSEKELDCAQVAVCFDRVLESFNTAEISANEDQHGDQYITLYVYSRALYGYYTQKKASEDYYRNLPDKMKGDFLPYKKAMEHQLQEYLRQIDKKETGLKQVFTAVETDELPF